MNSLISFSISKFSIVSVVKSSPSTWRHLRPEWNRISKFYLKAGPEIRRLSAMKQTIIYFVLFFICLPAWSANMAEQFQIQSGRQFTFSATTTSTVAVSANQSRGYLIIQNSCASTDLITVVLRNIESAGNGIQLQPCGTYEFVKVPTNSVWLKSASGTQTAIIIEGVIASGETQ